MIARPFAIFLVGIALFAATKGNAGCTLRQDPRFLCGAGATAITGDVLSREADATDNPLQPLRVVVRSIAGVPIQGVAPGEQLELFVTQAPSTALLTPPLPQPDAPAFFILEDEATYVVGLPVIDDRVQLDDSGTSVSVANAMTDSVSEDGCGEAIFASLDPPRAPDDAQCAFSPGCTAATGSDVGVLGLCVGLLIRRRPRMASWRR